MLMHNAIYYEVITIIIISPNSVSARNIRRVAEMTKIRRKEVRVVFLNIAHTEKQSTEKTLVHKRPFIVIGRHKSCIMNR